MFAKNDYLSKNIRFFCVTVSFLNFYVKQTRAIQFIWNINNLFEEK